MAINIRPPKSGGGGGDFTDRWKPSKAKHNVRIYPFQHNGEVEMAAFQKIHFTTQGEAPSPCTGPGCPFCAEAKQTNNKRLRSVDRYSMAVVVEDEDTDVVMKWDAPQTAYRHVFNTLVSYQEDGGDVTDILGNKGQDFIVKYDKNAQPASQYQVSLRIKGSSEYDIIADDIPDLIQESEDNADNDLVEVVKVKVKPTNEDEEEEETEDGDEPEEWSDDTNIKFTDKEGKTQYGSWGGKERKEKLVVEFDGRLVYVEKDNVIETRED